MRDYKHQMQMMVQRFAESLRPIRSGTVDREFVAVIRVEGRYGTRALTELARIKAGGDRILVTPYESSDLPAISRAIREASLGVYALDPSTLCVSVPPISVEQRQAIAKRVKQMGEEARVAIRSIRQQARKNIESRGRGSFHAVQQDTDEAIAAVDLLVARKIKEIEKGS